MSWDDGSHAKVKKVQLTYDDVIYSIQVIYDGTALQSQRRGSVGPKSAEFTLASDEYITALSAYGKTLSTQDVITALTFTTNKKTYGPYGNKSGFQISAPEATGKQIAGFLGTSGNVLNSIDVHYAPIPTETGRDPQKLDPEGGKGGTAWDDGSDHDGVTKIYVKFGGDGIRYVKFEYVKDGQTKQGALHGEDFRGSTKEIVINHPEEYLVSVEGWYDSSNVILGIQFKTNKQSSEFIGYAFDGSGTKFTLQVQDKKIIGFHGFASSYLNSIGAYVVPLGTTPLTPAAPSKKLEGFGSEGGTLWDDGAFDGVRKVSVGQAQDGVGVVKFVYDKGSQVVVGNEHGKTTLLGFEDFVLDYPSEYITAVEGTYDTISASATSVITMLRFKTNKQTSPPFGLETPTAFVLKEEGYKIVGFHGRSSDLLHKVGLYVLPISK